MGTLSDFRAAVAQLLHDKAPSPLAVWTTTPDDVAELPCIVLARPSANETSVAIVYDLSLDLIVLGRRQAPGDGEDELVSLTDDVWAVLGGTRGTTAGAFKVSADRIDPRVSTVAGLDIPAYLITVVSSAATC